MIGALLRVRYELLNMLDDGPLFALYSARDQVQARDVGVRVLKAPFAAEQALVDRLKTCVAKSAALQHPNIERLYEVDDHEGTAFIVGELPRGTSLKERLQKLLSFSAPVASSAAISLCEALEAIHGAGIIHGDLGAHNVTVLSDGPARLQLTGIWEAYSASPTVGAMVLANMAPYLAPEVSAGGMPSVASDIYALGVLLFEMLAGRQPYVAETSVALAMKHGSAPTPSVRLFNSSVPMVLDEIVKKAMAKDSALRYSTATEMLADLRILQDGLRFGKSLTWPLRVPGGGAAVDHGPAAPQTPSPARTETRPIRKPQYDTDERDQGDVPGWLKISIVFFSAIFISMVGIWVVFNLNRAREVTVPNLLKMRTQDAESELRQAGITMIVQREQPSEKFGAGTIMETDPPASEKVREGGEVRVVVSSGSRFVDVPDLRGLTTDAAGMMLTKKRLRLDERWRQVPSSDVPAGLIVAQTPERGSRVERATSIRVDVSSGSRYGRSPPSVEERYSYTLKIKTSGVDKAVTVRVDMSDSRGNSTVHEALHEPDEEFTVVAEGYGPDAIFRIFYDGTLVKQVTKKASEGERL